MELNGKYNERRKNLGARNLKVKKNLTVTAH